MGGAEGVGVTSCVGGAGGSGGSWWVWGGAEGSGVELRGVGWSVAEERGRKLRIMSLDQIMKTRFTLTGGGWGRWAAHFMTWICTK